ncbi:MarR family winged helix-turn-helix transcriptional regulator [Microbulbifer thermotolerans]|uniref:MarR family transcriptional regulator n=1 Tax=Microbulbifer thermotolerans TaxID=252514 RepID=A0A143HPD3_MICTH|nr:MarR family transcriptional regulator [Microbulbifer thermotolerans]AMX03357.1 MarR family transcriptional regulator [Microbulbifer thermotolerans]MCX2781124.1 MarR family transcriptional regulator [Microbulbifer thermotolerans]MCX2782993.1 MarR family transcriptional regulator [Microbulbifer thermotolerans]MCX2795480.1 MarR family transcriptional regulator [Microbulbifer thermotolerans]MCX2801095.1 MarR family transcriptional regulator [Microbulbifer thermotolerans]
MSEDFDAAKGSAAEMSIELHSAARLLRRNFDRRAKAHGLSRSRWQVLWHLSREEGQKQAELAERMDVAPISLTRQLDNLQREGLVERRPDPEDRRCFRIYLTEAAQPALELLRGLAQQTRAQALAGFSAAEVRQLHGLLARLRENLTREEV